MNLRAALDVSDRHKRRLVRVLQAVLVAITVYGAYLGNVGLIVNAGISLGVTLLPAVLERDTRVSMDPGIVLWITSAVFLHAVGALGVYRSVPLYDQVAHALSSSVVAGVGYATIKAFDRHSSAVEFPPKFVFVFILLFVMAFGVLWEIIEFATGLLSQVVGGEAVLAQYGMSDIIYDLVFNQIGGLVVAAWGHTRLSDLSRDFEREMGGEGSGDSPETVGSEEARD